MSGGSRECAVRLAYLLRVLRREDDGANLDPTMRKSGTVDGTTSGQCLKLDKTPLFFEASAQTSAPNSLYPDSKDLSAKNDGAMVFVGNRLGCKLGVILISFISKHVLISMIRSAATKF